MAEVLRDLIVGLKQMEKDDGRLELLEMHAPLLEGLTSEQFCAILDALKMDLTRHAALQLLVKPGTPYAS